VISVSSLHLPAAALCQDRLGERYKNVAEIKPLIRCPFRSRRIRNAAYNYDAATYDKAREVALEGRGEPAFLGYCGTGQEDPRRGNKLQFLADSQ
jgi:hypothetical protein